MLNKVVIAGKLTKDTQIFEEEDRKITAFCIAAHRNYKDENGEIICDYLFCRAPDKLVSSIEEHTNQGTLVSTTGRMRSRKYDKDEQTHFVTELYVETIKSIPPKPQDSEVLPDSI